MPIKIKYNLVSHKDYRGSFVEFVRTKIMVNFLFLRRKKIKQILRSFKVEKFLVVNGKAKFFMKDISSNKN